MTIHSSATHSVAPVLPEASAPVAARSGIGWGLLGVTAFSFTVPCTRIAVEGGAMSPLFVGAGRAVVAALLAAVALAATRQRLPRGTQWARLAVVAAGVVAGFPLLTSYALTTASAGHAAVVIALLPAVTAVLAVLRTRERPPRAFWFTAAAGAVAAVGFASFQGGGASGPAWSDLLLLGAVLAAGVGYAEGGLLARELGAWQTISWALVLSAPPMAALTAVAAARHTPTGTPAEWAAFGYLGVVSMFLGFFAWYRGLAIGPMARVSQIQLVQPVLGIGWAALLLREPITWATVLGGLAVVGCAGTAVRSRSRTGPKAVAEPRPGTRPRYSKAAAASRSAAATTSGASGPGSPGR
ncbi:DMT family transporter [Streptomyces lichenis]|uniref:DMT family transporter n=1 Tax=Streptomyces lichenis TaxID=2306967 RepID=A0ABT0I8L2_9ACTN|nr:DMT family transporter [Streptomyces lichenis]MCK8677652.1 DMT family transporter [Streptomyces lichenis]